MDVQLKNGCNVDFTSKCILQCVYCQRQAWDEEFNVGGAVGRNKVKISGDMPFEDFKKIGQTFNNMYLCGQISDPIYHPHLIKYLRYASAHKLIIKKTLLRNL